MLDSGTWRGTLRSSNCGEEEFFTFCKGTWNSDLGEQVAARLDVTVAAQSTSDDLENNTNCLDQHEYQNAKGYQTEKKSNVKNNNKQEDKKHDQISESESRLFEDAYCLMETRDNGW